MAEFQYRQAGVCLVRMYLLVQGGVSLDFSPYRQAVRNGHPSVDGFEVLIERAGGRTKVRRKELETITDAHSLLDRAWAYRRGPKNQPCPQCDGTGHYGRVTRLGHADCVACDGKGYQTPEDVHRCRAYDRYRMA